MHRRDRAQADELPAAAQPKFRAQLASQASASSGWPSSASLRPSASRRPSRKVRAVRAARSSPRQPAAGAPSTLPASKALSAIRVGAPMATKSDVAVVDQLDRGHHVADGGGHLGAAV